MVVIRANQRPPYIPSDVALLYLYREGAPLEAHHFELDPFRGLNGVQSLLCFESLQTVFLGSEYMVSPSWAMNQSVNQS